MQLTRFRFSTDWLAGSFSNAHLDTAVNISQYNHPSVIPGTSITSTSQLSGARALLAPTLTTVFASEAVGNDFGNGTGSWAGVDQFALTSTSGDYVSFTTTAQQVTFWLAGLMTSGAGAVVGADALTGSNSLSGTVQGIQSGTMRVGQIRNGAVAELFVNGTFLGTVDTWKGTPQVTIAGLSGTSTIKIRHSGGYNNAFAPWTTPSAVSGTLLAGNLIISAKSQPTFLAAQWRVVANVAGGGTWKIQKNTNTPESPTWTDQVTGLAYGATDTTHVSGLSISVPTAAYASNETAQFNTEPSQIAVEAIVLGSGSGSGAGQYTSALVDSGDMNTQWFLAEWVEPPGVGMQSFTLQTGNSTNPHDGTWQTYTVTPGSATLPVAGTGMGFAGLMKAPRGRYAIWTITFAPAITQPFFRDLSLYYWTPEADPHLLAKLGWGKDAVLGPNALSIMGTLACFLAATRAAAMDFVQSFAINQAVDQYLQGYGNDLELIQYPAEPPQSFQQRVITSFRSRAQGGSLPFICLMLSELVTGQSGTPVVTGVSGSQVASLNGVVVSQKSGQQFSVTIPAASGGSGYAGLPGLPTPTARSIIETYLLTLLTPVGSVISPGVPLGTANPSPVNLTFQ